MDLKAHRLIPDVTFKVTTYITIDAYKTVYYRDIFVNKVTVKVTIKSQSIHLFLNFYMNILKNNVTPKSRKICSFCDFIVTNILVNPMIISTYNVTLNYIRKPVLLSQIDQWASSIPKALICALIAKIRGFHYMILFTTPRLLITSSSWTNRTCSIPALYPLYIRLVSGSV